MPNFGKTSNAVPLPPDASELTTGALLGGLHANGEKALIFTYEGRDVLPGYHVTEVKDGTFQGLDCDAHPESWRETFIQLWDVPSDDGSTSMPVSRFLAIMLKVSDHVPFDPTAKLTFEVSDGMGAIQLFRAETIEAGDNDVRVELSRRPASCKPRDRWLEQQKANACCESSVRPC